MIRDYLTIAVVASVGSMGSDVTGNERLGWDRPGRSAILGMVAAALGVTRKDEEAHLEMERVLGMAMMIEQPGPSFIDFHTIQIPGTSAGRERGGYETRHDEVAAIIPHEDFPVVTLREYRLFPCVIVALWLRESSQKFDLETLRAALWYPAFPIYMGRKSCTLSLPMGPCIFTAYNPIDALRERLTNADERRFIEPLLFKSDELLFSLDEADLPEKLEDVIQARIEYRFDRLLSRARWQFGSRAEALITQPRVIENPP